MIDGWEEAIKTMRVGERAIVRITDPNLGYGAAGVVPVVPPNAVIELDLEIMDAKARSAIDFDTLAIGDPDTPVCCCFSCGFMYFLCVCHAVIIKACSSRRSVRSVWQFLAVSSYMLTCTAALK